MPTYVPGVDTALLAKVNLNTEASWTQSQQQVETNDIQKVTFDTLFTNQQTFAAGFIAKLKNPDKNYDVKVYWPDFCGLEAVDGVTDVCEDLDLDMAPVKETPYKIESSVETGFAIEEDKLADSEIDPAMLIGQSQNQAVKRILQKLSAKGVAFLSGNAGYNAGGQFPVTEGTNISEVAQSNYNTGLVPKIMFDMISSQMPNAFVIDGGKLYEPFTNASFNTANGEGKGDAARSKMFNTSFDILGFSGATLSDRTFVVAPYSYAFLHKNYYSNTVPVWDEALKKWVYSISIPMYGLKLDVFMQRVCVDGEKKKFKINWLYKCHYDYKLNPAGCDRGDGNVVTGILEYKQVANPE